MPGGFLKKLGTASCGITGTLVAVALLCADTGREIGANINPRRVQQHALVRHPGAVVDAVVDGEPVAEILEHRPPR